MEIKVRETREEDFEAVKGLLEKEGVIPGFSKNMFRKMLKRNKGFYLVAESQGEVIGTVFGLHDGNLLGSVYKLAVAKEFQRQKVATILCKELLKKFRELNVDTVYSLVHKVNSKSIQFFKKLGFRIREDVYLMDNSKE